MRAYGLSFSAALCCNTRSWLQRRLAHRACLVSITEDHAARRRVLNGQHLCADCLTNEIAATIDHNHCAIFQVTNTLTWFLSETLDLHFKEFTTVNRVIAACMI